MAYTLFLFAGEALYVEENQVILTVCKTMFLFGLSVSRVTC